MRSIRKREKIAYQKTIYVYKSSVKDIFDWSEKSYSILLSHLDEITGVDRVGKRYPSSHGSEMCKHPVPVSANFFWPRGVYCCKTKKIMQASSSLLDCFIKFAIWFRQLSHVARDHLRHRIRVRTMEWWPGVMHMTDGCVVIRLLGSYELLHSRWWLGSSSRPIEPETQETRAVIAVINLVLASIISPHRGGHSCVKLFKLASASQVNQQDSRSYVTKK